MDRTEFNDGVITVGELEFKGLMIQLIHRYDYVKGEQPTKIVLPALTEINGVVIEHEEVKVAVSSGKSETI